MIAELGHYALVLALALALIQSWSPVIGARKGDVALMKLADSTALAQFAFVALAFGALTDCYVTSDFSVANVFENSHTADAADLQVHQRLGQPRRLDAAVGADPGVLRRAGRAVRRQSAGDAEGQRAGGAVLDRGGLLSLHSVHLEPVPAAGRGAGRGPRPQSDPAGFRPRGASADALSRLCRLLDRVLLRGRRPDRGPHRCGLGALGAAVDAARLDVPDARHRDGLLLGLLRARLGRLVVLGSGGERLADALARRHRAAAFGGGDGKAQCAEGVDHPAGDPHLLAVADRHLPGALGRADLGPHLLRPIPRAACSSW